MAIRCFEVTRINCKAQLYHNMTNIDAEKITEPPLLQTLSLMEIENLRPGVGNLRPAGQIWPADRFYPARGLFEIVYLSGPRPLHVIMTISVANKRLAITI